MGCYKCPVCDGRGYVSNNFYNVTPNVENYNTNSTSMEICRSCKGTGIVWEPVNNVPFITGLSTAEDVEPTEKAKVTVTTFNDIHSCIHCDFHKKLKNCVDTVFCTKHKEYRQNSDYCVDWQRTTATNNTQV